MFVGEESDIQDYANLKGDLLRTLSSPCIIFNVTCVALYEGFFLAVETALDGIQFPDGGKKEIVKSGE